MSNLFFERCINELHVYKQGCSYGAFYSIKQLLRTYNFRILPPVMKPFAIKFPFFLSLLLLCLNCQPAYSPDEEIVAQLPEKVDFNYHIKPILSDRCFACHGPDKNALEANLQLNTVTGALKQVLSSGQHAFVSGNVKKSEAFQRMLSLDPEMQMPPPDFQRSLSDYEIALIAKWIEQGAEYKPHWAFIPATKRERPKVSQENWCSNAIDFFILKKLEEQGLKPKKEADKEMLLRRVTLDLTGLPPTIAEIDDFFNDNSPGAYEKVVDRLLASPHYGERMALAWLDLARYADSNGYSQDGLRIMWPWRDWVIKAFNKNMPYDQFISWQIAGDKMPNATQEQKLATGFLRNHRLNGEGGIIDEEYRVEYAADRTETAATVFLGLTMQCARCHDHKYDPISQKEYYQFFSFFNSVHETGITANDGNSGPEVVLTSEEVDDRIDFINKMIDKQEKEAEKILATLPASLYQQPELNLEKGLLIDLSFDKGREQKFINEVEPKETFSVSGTIDSVKGVFGNAIRFTAYDFVNIRKGQLDFDRADVFSFSFYFKPNQEGHFTSILNHLGSAAINFPGYEIAVINGYPAMRLVHSLPANLIDVRGSEKIKKGEWTHLVFTYDGSGKASGIKLFVNGEQQKTTIKYDKLTQSFANGRKVLTVGGRIGYQTETEGYGFIDDLKIYGRKLSVLEVHKLYNSIDKVDRPFTEEERKTHFLVNNHEEYTKALEEIQRLRKEKFQTQDTLISTMVMEDLPEPRPTYVLNRGVYDAPEEEVYPGTPETILPFSENLRSDRSGLSSWLLDEDNPLTARVAVNRFWQLFFGQGIVKTTEDFGNQGALPSHPELLDWLAVHFMESGWDVKALHKMIVLSATYRQSSRVSMQERLADPDNVLLGRGPSRRLPAELIRDGALAASGLLTKKIGGPSVKPYQPEGLWSEKGEFSILKNYNQDKGDNLYRRGLYTFWRRTSPPPSMTTFDAPSREVCIVSRQETNTPLQALVLLNDPQYVEAARLLAERVIRAVPDKKGQIVQAHRLLTGLHPQAEVISLLRELETRENEKFEQNPVLAEKLMEVGEYPWDKSLAASKVAAMTIVCSTIMSFDETLIKR